MTDLSTHRQEDHGHEKLLTIIVNGRERQVTSKELTYEEVVRLAYDNPPTGPNADHSHLPAWAWRKARGEPH